MGFGINMWCEKYSGNSETEDRATAELKKNFKNQVMKNSKNEITHTYHIGGMGCG